MFVSHHVVAGNRTLEEQPALLNAEPCLQPLGLLEEQTASAFKR